MAARDPGVLGPAEADGYRRYVEFVSEALPPARCATSSTATSTRRSDLARGRRWPGSRRSAGSAAWRPTVAQLLRGRAAPAGLQLPGHVRRAVAARRRSRSTRSSPTWTLVAGVYFPVGGMNAAARPRWPPRPAKHGVEICYDTEVSEVELAGRAGPRGASPPTVERVAADVARAHPGPARAPASCSAGPRAGPAPTRLLPLAAWSCSAGLDALPGRGAPHHRLRPRVVARSSTSSTHGPAHERPVVPRVPARRRPTRAWRPTGAARLRPVPDPQPRRRASGLGADARPLPRADARHARGRAAGPASATRSTSRC